MTFGGPGPQILRANSVRNGSTLPSSPQPGDVFERTGVTDPGFYTCASAGVWLGPYPTSAGSGDVAGPASSTDNAVARFDSTTGKIIQNSGVVVDDNNNLTASNLAPGFATTATAAGTTTLTVASKGVQAFTGSTTQTVVLPVVSTLPQTGFGFVVQNDSSDVLTVNSSGGNLVQPVAAGARAWFTCKLLTGTSAASWNVSYLPASFGITNSAPSGTIPVTTSDGNLITGSLLDDAAGALSVGASVPLSFTSDTSIAHIAPNVVLTAGTSSVDVSSSNETVIITTNDFIRLTGGNLRVNMPLVRFEDAAYQGCTALSTDVSGNLVCTVSDLRMKDVRTPFVDGLNAINRITPQTFFWKDGRTPGLQGGLIAQDVQQAIPLAVSENGAGMLQLNEPTLIAVLINAVKELKQRVEVLEDENTTLKKLVSKP
jgi:hypothetical protein